MDLESSHHKQNNCDIRYGNRCHLNLLWWSICNTYKNKNHDIVQVKQIQYYATILQYERNKEREGGERREKKEKKKATKRYKLSNNKFPVMKLTRRLSGAKEEIRAE